MDSGTSDQAALAFFAAPPRQADAKSARRHRQGQPAEGRSSGKHGAPHAPGLEQPSGPWRMVDAQASERSGTNPSELRASARRARLPIRQRRFSPALARASAPARRVSSLFAIVCRTGGSAGDGGAQGPCRWTAVSGARWPGLESLLGVAIVRAFDITSFATKSRTRSVPAFVTLSRRDPMHPLGRRHVDGHRVGMGVLVLRRQRSIRF